MNSEAAWRHACDHYARPGVAKQLLYEQDERGLDVVLHLFALYVDEVLGMALDEAALAEADAVVRTWREEVLTPLRAVRRATNEKPAPGAGGTEAGGAVLRLLQEAELRAERAELDALCDWFGTRGR
jgi:uncharacterized protein (TIGR02444 family)